MAQQGELQVVIGVFSQTTQHDEERFVQEVERLRGGLRRSGIQVEDLEKPGTKGGADLMQTFVLGGAGLTAVISVVRQWIKDRGNRTVRLLVRHPEGREHVIELDAHNIADDTLLKFFKEATDDLSE